MRCLCLLAALSMMAACSASDEPEYFEGVVHIDVTIDAHDTRISQELLHWWFGSTLTWTLKDGDYRIDYENADRASVWYRRAENREYQLRSCADHITWTPADTPLAEILSVTKLDETRNIAGYTTHALEVRSLTDDGNEAVTRYWYAPELKVNPAWYSESRTLGWDRVYQEIDSLIIGSEDVSDFVALRRFATRVDVRSVDESALDLPEMGTRYASLEDLLSTPPCLMPQ